MADALSCYICGAKLGDVVEIVRPQPTGAKLFPPYFAPCCFQCKNRERQAALIRRVMAQPLTLKDTSNDD